MKCSPNHLWAIRISSTIVMQNIKNIKSIIAMVCTTATTIVTIAMVYITDMVATQSTIAITLTTQAIPAIRVTEFITVMLYTTVIFLSPIIII